MIFELLCKIKKILLSGMIKFGDFQLIMSFFPLAIFVEHLKAGYARGLIQF